MATVADCIEFQYDSPLFEDIVILQQSVTKFNIGQDNCSNSVCFVNATLGHTGCYAHSGPQHQEKKYQSSP